MPLSLNEIRDRATAFAREWRDAASEQAEAQSFWNGFFEVFGLNRRRVAMFEKPVANLLNHHARGRVDLLWKGTLLVEHKSRGQDLDVAAKQARDYFPGLRDNELPRFVIVSDFFRLRLHDLEAGTETEFTLPELPKHLGLFGFISGYETRRSVALAPVDVEAAQKLGALHDLLEDDRYIGHDLDVWMVRTLFCLFADTTGIFETGVFRALVEQRTAEDGNDLGAWLGRLHSVLATPDAARQKALDEQLRAFPYVNGRLFDARIDEPATTRAMREALLDCCRIDWSRVSPAIFGSLFQSIKDRAERRRGGEHYTTEANILKCLDPLFLDGLRAELAAAGTDERRLNAFQQRLRRVRVFDPACGCGNFLVVAYRELRLLEHAALRRLYGHDDAGQLAGVVLSTVNVDQLFGIEIGDWPAQIAQVALWLTDHQMNRDLSEEFGTIRLRLPLKTAPNIRAGANALREDWADFIRPGADVFCVGNPPFIGAKVASAAQKADTALIYAGVKNAGLLDYVANWYRKAADWMAGDPRSECCFVSTNSITQGEQPAVLWADLWPRGVIINFAHRTFAWTSEARGKAAVHCVIVGFGLRDRAAKTLWDYDSPRAPAQAIAARQINPYLVDGPQTVLKRRTSAVIDAPVIYSGNQPLENGLYLFDDPERIEFVVKEPKAAKFFRQILGSDEFLYGIKRWFLDLRDATPFEIRTMPEVNNRVTKVKAWRLSRKRIQTKALADFPTQVGIGIFPAHIYLGVPKVSSELRNYIPLDFLSPSVICTDLMFLIPTAQPYHFAILTSRMHMAWVRGTCGRLKSDFRYSAGIVFNNFPWPDPTPAQRAAIEATAQTILDARKNHPGATLADLYDPVAMPPDLARAHAANDRAVDAAYGQPRGFATEAARLAFLFARYQALAAPLDVAGAAPKRRPRRAKVAG